MAGARSVEGGETKWSKCSADKLKRFNKACVFEQEERTGEEKQVQQSSKQKLASVKAVTAAEQCKLFLKDSEADVVENSCASLLCSSKTVNTSDVFVFLLQSRVHSFVYPEIHLKRLVQNHCNQERTALIHVNGPEK